ncbi:hypothetical protein Q7A53_10940 [Halobacillus rhizosphaerae]|uniref:hypothetical protein n=1 Tax=Halobacillus rhizosphaerae TaxID=3064889 RepID=UPI00398B54E8
MKHIFAFENKSDYEQFDGIIVNFRKKLSNYQKILEEQYALKEAPKAIVWTSEELATNIFSNLPIPAFTNENIIYFSPDLSAWRRLFIQQLEGRKAPEIRRYYEHLSENQLVTILGHELTHHSDLFVDEFDEERVDSIWFEEGMCDYLARKYILSETEFMEIVNAEAQMIVLFKDKYGHHSLDEFGGESYQGSLTSIMYNYWRSFQAVKYLVEDKADHDIDHIFKEYQSWNHNGRKVPLTDYFNLPDHFS